MLSSMCVCAYVYREGMYKEVWTGDKRKEMRYIPKENVTRYSVQMNIKNKIMR